MTALTKTFYLENQGKQVKVGRYVVTVSKHRTESRGGSWERGFRFSDSDWAMLKRETKKPIRRYFSFDNGKTWHLDRRDGFRLSKGKTRLSGSNHGELAFEGIQRINRQWEGPNYRWHR